MVVAWSYGLYGEGEEGEDGGEMHWMMVGWRWGGGG